MDKPQRKVRVTRTTDERTPKSVRKLGRALIALAQAQLEAEAQAQADAKATRSPGRPATAKRADDKHNDHAAGDAA